MKRRKQFLLLLTLVLLGTATGCGRGDQRESSSEMTKSTAASESMTSTEHLEKSTADYTENPSSYNHTVHTSENGLIDDVSRGLDDMGNDISKGLDDMRDSTHAGVNETNSTGNR